MQGKPLYWDLLCICIASLIHKAVIRQLPFKPAAEIAIVQANSGEKRGKFIKYICEIAGVTPYTGLDMRILRH
ncbi:hypothetical protein D3C72_2229200 [compost metagenome]